jgi:tetratricopeptide (TPR) repeat protein
MSNLASGYKDAGRLEEAVPLLEETLRRQRAKLGADHPHTLISMNHLANGYNESGRLGEAMPLYEEALRRREAKLGGKHSDTLISIDGLASALIQQRKFEEAKPIINRWMSRLDARNQQAKQARAETLRAICLFELGQAAEALDAAKSALEVKESNEFERLRAQSVLAAGLATQGDSAAAEQLIQAYQELRERLADIKRHERWWVARACERVVAMYKTTDQAEKIAEWEAELAEVNAEIEHLSKPKSTSSAEQ